MMIYSKVVPDEKVLSLFHSLPYTCYELCHTSEPSCTQAIFDLFKVTLKNSLKLYISFYLVTSLLQKPWKKWKTCKEMKKLAINIIRSSLFLTAYGTMTMMGCCITWHTFGGFYGCHGIVNGFLIGYLLLDLEANSRKNLISLATAIWAAETLFRMVTFRKWMTPLPNGEVVIFCIASTGLMALYRKSEKLSKSMQSPLRLFLGNCEKGEPGLDAFTEKYLQFLPKPCHDVLKRLQVCHRRHNTCRHYHSCVYYVLEGFIRNFVMGCGLDLALYLMQIIRGSRKTASLIQRFSLSLFFGGYSFLFRACNCLLRWARNKDCPLIHGGIAGAVAGISSWFYKSSTISLYFLFKLLEVLVQKAVEKEVIPYCKRGYLYLHMVSMAILLHSCFMEPHNTAPKFLKMVNDVSEGRMDAGFRAMLEVFGTKASTKDPDFIPTLDRRFVRSPDIIKILTAHGKLK